MKFKIYYQNTLSFKLLERVAGIEPAPKAWKALMIPFHNTRAVLDPYVSQKLRSIPEAKNTTADSDRIETTHNM